jgi:hypothetical protein
LECEYADDLHIVNIGCFLCEFGKLVKYLLKPGGVKQKIYKLKAPCDSAQHAALFLRGISKARVEQAAIALTAELRGVFGTIAGADKLLMRLFHDDSVVCALSVARSRLGSEVSNAAEEGEGEEEGEVQDDAEEGEGEEAEVPDEAAAEEGEVDELRLSETPWFLSVLRHVRRPVRQQLIDIADNYPAPVIAGEIAVRKKLTILNSADRGRRGNPMTMPQADHSWGTPGQPTLVPRGDEDADVMVGAPLVQTFPTFLEDQVVHVEPIECKLVNF